MNTNMRKSYFISDCGALYYVGSDRGVHKIDLASLLYMHEKDHAGFEKLLDGLKDEYIVMCEPGEYIFVDADSEEKSKFGHMSYGTFRKLIRDPDTIRLRYALDSVTLLEYNPAALI